MIVAGIGCRKDVSASEVLAAIESALSSHNLGAKSLGALATASLKRDEAGILTASKKMGLDVITVEDEALERVSSRILNFSEKSMSVARTPSVSEAAALVAAGEGSRLLGPRVVLGAVTCAIAIQGEAS